MVKKEKSGLLSWFGFGQKKSPPESQAEQDNHNQEESPLADDSSQDSPVESSEQDHSPLAEDLPEETSASVLQEDTAEEIPAEQSAQTSQQLSPQEVASVDNGCIQEPTNDESANHTVELMTDEEQETREDDDTDLESPDPQLSAEQESPKGNKTREQEKPKQGFFSKLTSSLKKTRQNLGFGFWTILKGKKIDTDLYEEIEEQLLIADIGLETTSTIIKKLTHKASLNALQNAEPLYQLLKDDMAEILSTVEQPLVISDEKKPTVILMVGVNGVGKTTTIGKLAKKLQQEGKSVMLAAGDTFRAAAVEQLQVWGERNEIPVVAQHTGADSASVIFDTLAAAKAKQIDVVIADTAGRLQNKGHLMEELRKIVRVIGKFDPSAPHEILLTLDATTGQNAISQVKLFNDVAPITGLALTKLDGSAKGGVIFSLADQFKIPIRFIGIGEGIDDLRPFDAKTFIDALFAHDE